MNEKYIYFEVYWISNSNGYITSPILQNENILMIKPKTNSDGIWGYRNVTERKGKDEFVTVDQYWINLKIYKPYEIDVDDFLQEALSKLNIKLRSAKLKNLNESR